jgi:hypothetical protein
VHLFRVREVVAVHLFRVTESDMENEKASVKGGR